MLQHHSFAKKGNEYAGQVPTWKGSKMIPKSLFWKEK